MNYTRATGKATQHRPAGASDRLITFVPDRPGHGLRYTPDSAKLRREPTTPFEQVLATTIETQLE